MHGSPETFNTDQGAQFTSNAFTKILLDNEIKISMDGKGHFLGNIFVERLWLSVKYEYIYLNLPENGVKLYHGLEVYFYHNNHERLYLSIERVQYNGTVSKFLIFYLFLHFTPQFSKIFFPY